MTELPIANSLVARLRAFLNSRPRSWLFSLMAVIVLAGAVSAATPKFAISKDLCSGNALTMVDPTNCTPISQVPQGTVSYYMITLTSPWGEPAQTIDLTDQMPSDFTPAIGGIFCRDENNQPVAWTPSNASTTLMTVQLGAGQTVHCFIAGTMTGTSGQTGAHAVTNTASGKNGAGYTNSGADTSSVLTASPLGADLAVTKTASPTSVNVSNGPQTVTYTIIIKNNGPNAVDVGDAFKLHDSLALLPNSVPLTAAITGASSTATTGSDPLNPAGPQMDPSYNNFVGTMNQHHAFDWGFAPGTGHIAVGGVITITMTVQFSGISGINCVIDPTANGLKNTVFFTLTNPANGTALNDNNSANNTASANVSVITGGQVDPDCGKGQLKISKVQLAPPPTSLVGWGQQVDYQITITNVSVPAQSITLKKHDLQDWVEEGINTPPFTRNHMVTTCDPVLSSPGVCGSSSFVVKPPHKYNYYGELDQAWDNNTQYVLSAPGQKIVFKTSFKYTDPDCETVPNSPTRPIINHIRATYKASPFGSPNGSPQVVQSQAAKAETLMKQQPPCKFKVTKLRTSPTGPLQFGVQQNYTVTFQNQGIGRKIGTVMDAVRISVPGYASILPFASSWNCTTAGPGWTFNTLTGSQPSGIATYVGSPAQGSAAALINLASNTFFPQNGILTCNIGITVGRPPLHDKFCTSDDAYFENVALMDVTTPFNPNIFWPPSGIYNPSLLVNPQPQIRNWASVRTMLPKCWDAQVSKKATVGGLPGGTAPWTYAGNPNPVNYAITVTNLAQSNLSGPNIPGWIVQDKFDAAGPYSSGQQTFINCTPSTWCWSGAPHNPKGEVGIKFLNKYGQAGSQGDWNLQLPGSAVQQGKDILNCAWILPQGVQAGADWYNNSVLSPIPTHTCSENPSVPSHACPPDSPLVACVKVPVIEVTKISVRKEIVDQTGANVTAASGYAITVGCTPYAVPTNAGGSITLNTGSTGTSPYQSVYPVPMTGTCTVTETANPIPSAISAKCGGLANVIATVSSTPLPSPLNPVDNQVTVTNTYSCKPPANSGQLEVIKQLNTIQHPIQFPATNWLINTNCTPAATASTLTLTTPASGNAQITASGMVNAPVGSTCAVSEQLPANSLIPSWFKNNCIAQGGTAVWDTPQYSVNGGPASATAPSVPISSGVQTVTVINGWHCGPAAPANGQVQIFKQVKGPATVPPPPTFSGTYVINSNCSVPSSPTSVSITTTSQGGGGAITAPVGTNCGFTETQPAFPAGLINCGTGQVPVWDPPVYTLIPGNTPVTMPLNITTGLQNLLVTNTWKCAGQLTIVKTLVDQNQIGTSVSAQDYVVDVTCTTPNSANTYPINTNYTATIVVPAAIGATCTVTEQAPPVPPEITAHCAAVNSTVAPWTTSYSVSGGPALTTSTPLVISSVTANNIVRVYNGWHCANNQKVKPKKKRGFHFNIGIGIGGGGGGKKQDKPPTDPAQPRP